MLNLAVVIIVLVSLSLAFSAYWFFGRSSKTDGFETENDAVTEEGPVDDSEVRTQDMKDREFAEHLLRANVYTRVYEAFESATGNKPTLDEVEAIIRAYRDGSVTLDGLEDYIRSNPDLGSGSGDGSGSSGGNDRSGKDDGGDDGEDRTGEESGHPGDDRFVENERDDKTNDDRFDNKHEEDPVSGHDRFEDDGENNDETNSTDDESPMDDDVLRSNVRKLLKLAGVVVNEDAVKRVLDRARQGLSSLSDLIQEEVQKNTS